MELMLSYPQNEQLIAIVDALLNDLGGAGSLKKITLDLSLQKHLGLDSIGLAELLSRIEKSFHIQLPTAVFFEADTLADIAKAIHMAAPKNAVKPDKQTSNSSFQVTTPPVDLASAHTLIESLILHAKATPDKPHVHLLLDDGTEQMITYGMLLHKSLEYAKTLQQLGLKKSETAAIMLPTSFEFFYTFFGILFAGGIPVPIYPPLRLNQIETYAKQEVAILKNAEARVLITFPKAKKLCRLLKTLVPSIRAVVTTEELSIAEKITDYDLPRIDELALIQYTSGSTGQPKGVMLTHHNLISNICAYGVGIGVTSSDVVVSWLPLYHDLGLIGNWLGSLYYGVPLVAMSPLTFLSRPEKWFWAIHKHRCTIASGPNFAYELCTRKIDASMIEGLDLSSIRIAINGAEPIYPQTLTRFTEKFAAYGFKLEKFLPVYGLAETSLGLTSSPVGRPPRIDSLDKKIFENEHRAVPITNTMQDNSIQIVSCGYPLLDQIVRIVDSNNRELPERAIGQLQFKGSSSMQGYFNNPTATHEINHDGWWDSGDLAYQAEGEIFITGRKKDVIFKAGRNIYPSDIEKAIAGIEGIRPGCVIAFGVPDLSLGTDQLILVAELDKSKKNASFAIHDQIMRVIVENFNIKPDDIVLIPQRTIPKTSSGKLQRSACKKKYLENNLTNRFSFSQLQLLKFGLQVQLAKIKRGLINIGKTLYTSYFALVGIITLIPLLIAIQPASRNNASKFIKFWANIMCFLSLSPIKITGKEHLTASKPAIFMSNHTSYVDIVLLMKILPPNVVFVAKQALFNVPILSMLLKKLGCISVDKTNSFQGLEDIQKITLALNEGRSIFIFPEGTFTYSAGLHPFKLAAFKIAQALKMPICPIAIKGARHMLRDESYLFTPHPMTMTIGQLIYPEGDNELKRIIQLKNTVRSEIAKHCGEGSLEPMTSEIAPSSGSR